MIGGGGGGGGGIVKGVEGMRAFGRPGCALKPPPGVRRAARPAHSETAAARGRPAAVGTESSSCSTAK